MYYPPVETGFWRQLISQLEKVGSDKLVYSLVFLLPIFTVTVRHWVSNVFGLLSIVSLILLYLHRNTKVELAREEKILLWGFAAYFGVFILTSVVNGWGSAQTRHSGVEIRFLMFVPLYMAIRQMDSAAKWLITGCIFGVIFTAYDGARDVFVNNIDVYTGVYSPLFSGPVIVIMISLLIPYFYNTGDKKWMKLFLLTLACMAFFVVAQTGARNAYLAVVVLGLLFIAHQYKGVKRVVLIGAVFMFAYSSYLFVPKVHDRLNTAYKETTDYFAYTNPATFQGALTSVGTRMEMWRVTPIFLKDHPVFGVSRGNYSEGVKKYISAGLVHPDIGRHGHPHNVYSEAIISKGLLGFIALLWIMVYPLVILVRDYRRNMRSAFYGIVLISAYMVMSLTDASTLIKGNYSSIYILFLAVLFSYHFQQKAKQS